MKRQKVVNIQKLAAWFQYPFSWRRFRVEIVKSKPDTLAPGSHSIFDFKSSMSSPLIEATEHICYRCRRTASENEDLIGCNYCPLYWHLSCIPPPFSTEGKNWMCPKHQKTFDVIEMNNIFLIFSPLNKF